LYKDSSRDISDLSSQNIGRNIGLLDLIAELTSPSSHIILDLLLTVRTSQIEHSFIVHHLRDITIDLKELGLVVSTIGLI
jgi:hypothetical protein